MSRPQIKIFEGSPTREEGVQEGGGFSLVASLRKGDQPSSSPIIPGEPNLPRGPPLGVVAYGVWGPVIQAPARGCPTIVGGLPPLIPWGKILPLPADRISAHPCQ